jgi:hypothetical protein
LGFVGNLGIWEGSVTVSGDSTWLDLVGLSLVFRQLDMVGRKGICECDCNIETPIINNYYWLSKSACTAQEHLFDSQRLLYFL